MIGKVGYFGFKLDDVLSANGNEAVTRSGPSILLINTNGEVCTVAMVQHCARVNRGLTDVSFSPRFEMVRECAQDRCSWERR